MRRVAGALALLAIGLTAGPALAQAGAGAEAGAGSGGDVACLTCHGEPEFLRSSVESAAEARALHVPLGPLAASGHADLNCSDCHESFTRFPHPTASETLTCATASCHTVETHPEWEGSVHARIQEDDGLAAADCAACHGVHDVAPLEALQVEAGPAQQRMNGECVSCHLEQAYTPADPHADSTSCAGCHAPHATAEVASPDSWVSPLAQATTCGACHEAAADSARVDIHGQALVAQGRTEPLAWPLVHESIEASPAAEDGYADDGHGSGAASDSIAPTCSDCHGAHPMAGPAGANGGEVVEDRRGRVVTDQDFQVFMIERCASCHTKASDTYAYTYHGKATRLGSGVSASCAQCHGAHSVMPADSASSSVHADNLIGTCGECHSEARAAFVLYDSHPDPHDREGTPVLYWSYIFMHALLIGTLGVFGLHTVLWWIRIWIDSRRAGAAGGHHA